MNALPYQQPPEPILLPLAGFLLALHFVAYPLDKLFACGLLGQLVVGIIWGPLASWLSLDIQRTVVQLGYIGIILLVYEGNAPPAVCGRYSKIAIVQGGCGRI